MDGSFSVVVAAVLPIIDVCDEVPDQRWAATVKNVMLNLQDQFFIPVLEETVHVHEDDAVL